MIRSLWLWCRGRVDGAGDGVSTFGYTAGTLGIPVAFLVATGVEATAVHLLVPWQWLRVALLVLTVASVAAAAGWLATRAVHPHLVTAQKLILRSGRATILSVDRGRIARALPSRRFQHTSPGIHHGRLYLPGPDGTVVDIDFDVPVPVDKLTATTQLESSLVTGVSLYVDAPRDLCARLSMRC
ncbi:hypothetical protein [Rhodococcus sp. AG1013]|uniref:hypothetical protein n=1 Tax=unclassified Rhodococcus (in: high G+C Gram-positive bacteria) TaxID=192944 RepID=UPI000E2C182A|nr:hypothetical protein [Rhodococcus sp. AG1013]RDI16733.1 hypothetical protein DEU38_12596 [Rhodococcus sp. AG1013]